MDTMLNMYDIIKVFIMTMRPKSVLIGCEVSLGC